MGKVSIIAITVCSCLLAVSQGYPQYTRAYRGYNDLDVRSNSDTLDLGNNYGGAAAIAQPSVQAHVGYGGNAYITPEALAFGGNGNSYSRSGSYGGDTAIAKPSVYANVGTSGSLTVSPRAVAATGEAARSYGQSQSARYYNRAYY